MDKILKAADDILNRFDPGIGWLDSERADVVKILKQLVEEKFTSTNTGSLQCPFLLVERFADNGALSHWALVNRETGEEEWAQQASA